MAELMVHVARVHQCNQHIHIQQGGALIPWLAHGVSSRS
jgi:hypothetical protein